MASNESSYSRMIASVGIADVSSSVTLSMLLGPSLGCMHFTSAPVRTPDSRETIAILLVNVSEVLGFTTRILGITAAPASELRDRMTKCDPRVTRIGTCQHAIRLQKTSMRRNYKLLSSSDVLPLLDTLVIDTLYREFLEEPTHRLHEKF